MSRGRKRGTTPDQAFGRALQALRKERGFSQERLAFEASLHPTYISLLERGLRSPSLKTLFQLGAVLSVRPSILVVGAEATLAPWNRQIGAGSKD